MNVERQHVANAEKADLFGRCFSEVSSNQNHSAELQERKIVFKVEHSEELHGGQLPSDDAIRRTITIQALRIARSPMV